MDPLNNVNRPAPDAASILAPGPAAPPPPVAPPAPPLGRAAGTAPLNDSRQLRSIGTGSLSLESLNGPKAAPEIKAADKVGLVGMAAKLGELGVVGALAAVAKAYTQTKFDPEAIGSSLGKLADNLQQVTGQVHALPGVGDAMLALGGLGAIASGIQGLRDGVNAAKSAQDTPEKVQASLGAAAGAAKLVGGLALALSPFCAPLGAVGAALVASGTVLEAGKVALENRAPLQRALLGVQFGLAAKLPTGSRLAIDQLTRVVSNNGASMAATPV